MERPDEIMLNKQSLIYLNETRKWTLFFSILGFIMIGFMLVLSFFIGNIMNSMPEFSNQQELSPGMSGGFLSFIYIFFAILYFFPIYYLYQFSVNMKLGIQQRSAELVESALSYQKSHYKFMGILTAILLAFYAVIIIGAAAVGAML